MKTSNILLLVIPILMLGCGGSGGTNDVAIEPPPQVSPPMITLSVESSSMEESSTIVITHSAEDYQNTPITSELSCDVGMLDNNNYTAPSVALESTATCIATATDSGNRTTAETLTLTIKTVTPVLVLANDETSVSTAKLTTIDISFADVAEGLIDATLNGELIKLGVTSDNKLVYFPSLYADGIQTLVIELEGEPVTYEYMATPSTDIIDDTFSYVSNYMAQMQTEVDEQIAKAQSKGLSSMEIQKLIDIKNSFDVAIMSELTTAEVDLLAYLIYQNISDIYINEETVNSSIYDTNLASFSIKPSDLTACERSAISIVISGGVAYTTTLAAAGLAGTGVGLPAASVVILGAAMSWNVLNNSLDRMAELCFDPFQTELDNINSANNQSRLALADKKTSLKVATAIKTTKEVDGILDFFHNKERAFIATRKYQVLIGAEAHVASIINAVNKVRGAVIELVSLIGTSNTPAFIINYIDSPVDVNDYLYEQIDPSLLSMSGLSSTNIHGYMIANGDILNLSFDIQDLNVGHVAFQFIVIDNGYDTLVNTVVDAEVTLNPPIAYDETFLAVIGEDMYARLQADFETGFKIITLPQLGILDTSGAFSYPGGGLFAYTPDETITEDISDSFKFIATNGSAQNNGESNIATVTIEIAGREDCSVYNSLVEGQWEVRDSDGTLYSLDVFSDGTGEYSFPDDPAKTWFMSWSIVESDKSGVQNSYPNPINAGAIGVEKYKCVMTDNGFFNRGVSDGFRSSLTRPLNEFFIYNGYDFEDPSNNPVYPDTPYTVIYTKL